MKKLIVKGVNPKLSQMQQDFILERNPEMKGMEAIPTNGQGDNGKPNYKVGDSVINERFLEFEE